jgi:hypothetical protein
MLLSVALFALFTAGIWLYCLTDAILTPAAECRGLCKRGWVALIAITFIAGAFAWIIVRRPVRDTARVRMPMPSWDPDRADDEGDLEGWTSTDDAAARHPAGRGKAADDHSAAKGPDDDPEFLRALDRVIRGNPPVS